MDKEQILKKYKNEDEKLLISRLFDKIDYVKKYNKITTTDFLNEHEQVILKNILNIIEFKNCVFSGGIDETDRKLLILYPEKMEELFEQNNFKLDTIFSVIRIELNKDDYGKFNYSIYLGGIMKLGVNRAKIGDIIVYENGADIIVKNEIEDFLYNNLKLLYRFSSSAICLIKLDEIKQIEKKFKEFKITVSSLRADNIIADLAKTSRNKAIEILEQERVFINYETETKQTKLIKKGDIISIRGKGKFIIDDINVNGRKNKFIVFIRKYI